MINWFKKNKKDQKDTSDSNKTSGSNSPIITAQGNVEYTVNIVSQGKDGEFSKETGESMNFKGNKISAHENDFKIFISYSREDMPEVDKIDNDFQSIGITFVRDERDLNYHQSIKDFMKSVRKADYVLMVISDNYLKSKYCMNEVLEFIKDDNYKDRILHVILDNCMDMFSPAGCVKYVAFWEEEYKKNKQAVSSLDPMNTGDLYKDLIVIENICRNISGFISVVCDMKHVRLAELKAKDYKPILDFIGYGSGHPIKKNTESDSGKALKSSGDSRLVHFHGFFGHSDEVDKVLKALNENSTLPCIVVSGK